MNVVLLESGSTTLLEDNFDLLLESGIAGSATGSVSLSTSSQRVVLSAEHARVVISANPT